MPHGLALIPSHQSPVTSHSNEIDSLVWGPIMLTLLVGTSEFQQDRGFFIGRNKVGQGMPGLCIGEMRHGTPASLPSIHMNRHLTFAAN